MFEIFADTRRLRVCKKEKITTTSAGINCLVKFSTDYVGHAIKLVFQINGKRWTVETQYNADGSTIRIPNDCFLPTTSPAWSPLNCELTCALRGEYIVEGGTTVTSRLPTVFTSMGIVEQGYDDAGAMTETAPTPTQVTQLETLVANCLSSAQMYTNMASSSATSASNSASIAASYAHMLSCMTVNAVGTAAGSTPTVTVNTVGNVYNFKFGIPKGETGATGPQGPAGADGRDGVDGADGIQGPQGPMGPAGRDGRDGTDGTNGRDGIDGQDGRDGVDGATGPQGPAGPTGPTGPEGPQGPQGPQGPEGPVKVTYHIVYETEPSGYTNPTITDVENWISDSSTVHIVRWKPADSTNYFDLTYTYSNQTYYYFCGASAQSRIIFARLRRSGSTSGAWSLSYVTLQKAGDTIFTSSNTFLVTYNASDPTQNTSLADIEAAFSAGNNLILDFHVNLGSSGICDGITGHLRYTNDLFYWYFAYATSGIRYVTLRRTGTTAGTWSTSGVTMQNSAYRTNEVAANATSSDYYPTCKGVADYAEPTSNKSTSIDESSDTKYPTTKAVSDYVADKQQIFFATYGSTTHATVIEKLNANYIVYCKYGGKMYQAVYNGDSAVVYFHCLLTATLFYLSLNTSNVWGNSSIKNDTSWNIDTLAPTGNYTKDVGIGNTYDILVNSGLTNLTIRMTQTVSSRMSGEVFIYTKETVPTITFIHSGNLPIYWSTGSAPTFALNHMYEINFRTIRSKVLCVCKDWGEMV